MTTGHVSIGGFIELRDEPFAMGTSTLLWELDDQVAFAIRAAFEPFGVLDEVMVNDGGGFVGVAPRRLLTDRNGAHGLIGWTAARALSAANRAGSEVVVRIRTEKRWGPDR